MLETVTVGQYMAKNLITLSPDNTVSDAIKLFLEKKISGAPVIDTEGSLIGVLSEGDCIRSEVIKDDSITVRELMTDSIDSVTPDVPIMSIADEFVQKRRRRLPVVENQVLPLKIL